MMSFRILAVLLTGLLCGQAGAGFVISVDPADLVFTGPGLHEVDLTMSYDGSGADTFNGIQIDITDAANAPVVQGDVPTGFTGVVVASNVNSGDRFALGDLLNFTVPAAPGELLTTLTFDVQDNQAFTIGLELQSLTRDSVMVDDPVTLPSSFTVSPVTAVPEPSCAFLLAAAVGIGAHRRRRS